MKSLLLGIILIGLCLICCKAQSQPVIRKTACTLTGKSYTIDCGAGNAVIIYESIIGSRQNNNGECGYTSGDCYENYPTSCLLDNQKCSIYGPNRNLTACNKKSDYLEVKYYCVPINPSNSYDICGSSEITQTSGLIKSPSYPTYKQTTGICRTKITVPTGKSLNIFVTDMNIQKRDSTEECKDYLIITDSTGDNDVCGNEKPVYAESLCSSVIYISYKAETAASFLSFYKGFKLYFEVRDLGASSSCGTATPSLPSDSTTTLPAPTVNPLDLVLNASQYFDFQICKQQQKTLTAPDFHVLYIEQLEYRAQQLSLGCLLPSPSHCASPHPLTCNLKRSCSFNLLADYTIEDCSKKKADYIFGIYRYIPIESKIRYFVCDTQVVNGDMSPNGLLFSKSYPNFSPNSNCVTKLQSSAPNKAFKIYITDIYLEDDCSKSYIQINDYKSPVATFCSSIDQRNTYTFTSCSNNIDISYRTSNQQNTDFRGFRAYYELVDLPTTCQNSLTTITSTTQAPLTTPLNDDVNSQVLTSGGNANGRPCQFPFKYQNQNYETCIAEGSNYWCSVTDNYDRDMIRGNCVPGLTTNKKFTVCDRKLRTFSCPKGYLINLVSVLGGSTSDNSCNEDKIRCSQSLYNQVQSFAASKQSFRIVNSFTLTECSNARVDVLIIDYNCVPDVVPYVKTYDTCTTGQTTDEKGIIISPYFPNPQVNFNCNLNIVTTSQKLLNLYVVSTQLQAILGSQECTESYFQLNNGDKICGLRNSGIIAQKCGTNFQLKYFVGSKAYKGFKLYYEITDVIDQIQCYEPTTTISPSISSTTPPSYVQQGIASGPQEIVNCKFSETITCPNDYVISVKRYFYGKSASNKCFYTQGDLISYSFQNVNCNGKRTCVLPTYFQYMVEHSTFSTYLQVEYECIPTKLPSRSMCGMTFTDKNGIITTPNYPTYDASLRCKTSIMTSSNNVIKAYIINLSIDTDCSKDLITFSEPGSSVSRQFCGQVTATLAYETCSNRLDIEINTQATSDNSFDGVSIYYEAVPKPIDFICTPPTTTSTTAKPTTTTTTKLITTSPNYLGLASPVETIARCQSETITCPKDYVIIVRSSFYGVKNSNNSCDYSPNDCFGPNTGASFSCSGKQSCFISFFPSGSQVPECDKKYASYFFLDYQCVPVKNAGVPPSTVNSEFCTPPSTSHTVAPGSSLILQSSNYPSYPTVAVNCNKTVITDPGYALDVFFIAGTFPGRVDCNGSTDFLKITDGFSNHKFCGSPNQAKYLMESRSNSLEVSFVASPQLFGFVYKGFQIYIQAVRLPITSTRPQQTTKPPVTAPIQVGFVSEEYYIDMCVFDSKTLTCPTNYIITVLQQSIVNARDGCDFKPGDCREPTDLVSTECAGKQTCNIYFPLTPITFCGRGNANGLEFTYQCVPSSPSTTIKAYSCDDKISNVKNGIIQSPKYPNYELKVGCEIELIPPEKSFVKIYLIDLGLSDSILEDALAVDDLILGENEDGMSRFLYSSEKPIKIKYKSLESANSSALESLRGFRMYFEAFPINENITSTIRVPTTTKYFNQFTFFTKIVNTKKSSNLIYFSLGIGLPCIVLLSIIMLFLNKSSTGSSSNLEIKYSNKRNKDGQLNEDIKSFSNPNLD
ncbi:unnamed protein product [Brachionus calyciflorus]|uniref:CUB domain-containing protein n=1 Tax=Brachionus calyciflorus TaxID=104777 RepID=A0A813P750_9BILA|nr:unnamed protein product [Brachionus calyciflorus]